MYFLFSWLSLWHKHQTNFIWPKVKVAQLCPTLCDPMDYTVHRILQARILEWVASPFSRGSSQPREWTQVSCIAGGFFTSWATREAQEYWSGLPIPSQGDLPDPGIELGSSALQVDSLPTELSGKPFISVVGNNLLLTDFSFCRSVKSEMILYCDIILNSLNS